MELKNNKEKNKDFPGNVEAFLARYFWEHKYKGFFAFLVTIAFFASVAIDKATNFIPESQRKEIVNEVMNGEFKDSNWDNLSSQWKKILFESANLDGDYKNMTAEKLEKIFSIRQIDLEDSGIRNITPLANGKFKNLTNLYASQRLNSIKGVGKIENLKHLDLSNSEVVSLSSVLETKNLETIDLRDTDIDKYEIDRIKNKMPNVEIKIQ